MRPDVLPLVLGFFAAERAADVGLSALDVWHTRRSPLVPEELEGLVDPAAAARARSYARARARLSLTRGLVGGAATLALLLSGALPFVDATLDRLSLRPADEYVVFLGALGLLLTLFDVPFAAWRSFVVERRFGAGRVGLRGFLTDHLRALALAVGLGVPFLYATRGALGAGGTGGWVRLLLLVVVAQAAVAFLWPRLVAPWLTRQRPLPPGPLADRLAALVVRAGSPAHALRLAACGQPGTCAPASVAGLLRPIILIDASLCERLTLDEVEAVVAHELAHVRLGHAWVRLAASLASSAAMTLPLLGLLRWPHLAQAFGYAQPTPHGVVALAALCGGALVFWLAPFSAWLSRRQEAEADLEAVRLTGRPEALGAALLDLAEDHLIDPAPHPFCVAWRFTHPPLAARLMGISRAADAR